MESDIITIAKEKAITYAYKERLTTPSSFPIESDIVQDFIRGFIAGYGEAIKHKHSKKKK